MIRWSHAKVADESAVLQDVTGNAPASRCRATEAGARGRTPAPGIGRGFAVHRAQRTPVARDTGACRLAGEAETKA